MCSSKDEMDRCRTKLDEGMGNDQRQGSSHRARSLSRLDRGQEAVRIQAHARALPDSILKGSLGRQANNP